MIVRPLRVATRLLRFLWVCSTAYLDGMRLRDGDGPRDYVRRAAWLRRHARRMARVVNLRIKVIGEPPRTPLVAGNHVSYLDIVVLGSSAPMVFVSKADVRRWPLIGPLTAFGGTLYLQRERRGDVADVAAQFAPIVADGVPVVMFLEGTSSDGRQILPFRPSLLEPAVREQWAVTPAWIGYTLPGGSAENEVAYWGDMTFFPHLLRLMGRRGVEATVVYGSPVPPHPDRKPLAQVLHQAVRDLHERHHPNPARA